MTIAIQEKEATPTAQHDLKQQLEQVLAELTELKTRMSLLERLASAAATPAAAKPAALTPAPKQSAPTVEKGIAEEEVLAISAAIAAWLGVQAHIRHIRLVRSAAWAQQGRVTIQASHSLLY